jgi:hypothetical protein
MKKLLLLLLLSALPLAAQRPVLEVDVYVTDAGDGLVGLTEVATDNLATNTVARVKGTTTIGDGGAQDYLWNGSAWAAIAGTSYSYTLAEIEADGFTKDTVILAEPIFTAAQGIPYTDPDAAAVITATAITDERGINHYRRIITGLKKIGVWADIESGFLFGGKHQSSSTTLKPFKGAADATGTGTNTDYAVTLNGTSNGYVVTNANPTTAATGRALVALYKDDGSQATAALISNYEGGVIRGMSMTVAGDAYSGTSSTLIDNLYCHVSLDGAAATAFPSVNLASDANWSFGAGSFLDGRITTMGNSRDVTTGTSATTWVNNATWGIGKTANGGQFMGGELAVAIIFKAGVSNDNLFKIRLLLEATLSDVHTFQPSIVWEGTSLVATSGNGGVSGGGTDFPTKVHLKAGWTTIRNENIAKGGTLQTQRLEAQYWNVARRWVAASRAQRYFVLWSGVNDITAGVSSANIIASMGRHLKAAKLDGFYTIILPVTPVADAADGLTYGYSSAQQTVLAEVNAWIAGEGAALADQFLDINLLANEYPEFGDPTDSTYYTAGDGLHQNDAGRALIADYFFANVTPPAT